MFFLFSSSSIFSQTSKNNKGLCKLEIVDVLKVTNFGYLTAYTVQFKNTTKKTIDGIWWTAYFYNNSEDLIKTIEGSFNSTNLIEPIASGFSKSLFRTPKAKGASKVYIVVNKVHFSDGTSCN